MTVSLTPPSDQDRLHWLRLIRSENVGPATFWALLERCGSAAAALDALPDLARRGGRARPLRLMPREDAERELEVLARFGGTLICLGDAAYPSALAAVDPPPPLLCVKGRAALLSDPAIAIVGARNASALGRQTAERLAADLTARGFAVVSGLARGIDTAAHQGALRGASDAGGTIAVMAGGVDHLYPPENDALYTRICDEGIALSEMPMSFTPQARHFPRRNRIVSGLALATVVIEAAARSGSLITARMALEQGREVFAVPGSPLDPRAKGANGLIKQGAGLVEDAADIVREIEPLLARPVQERFSEPPAAAETVPSVNDSGTDETLLEEARARLKPLLGPVATPGDRLAREAGLPASLCLSVLLQWELAGVVTREPGAGYVLTYGA